MRSFCLFMFYCFGLPWKWQDSLFCFVLFRSLGFFFSPFTCIPSHPEAVNGLIQNCTTSKCLQQMNIKTSSVFLLNWAIGVRSAINHLLWDSDGLSPFVCKGCTSLPIWVQAEFCWHFRPLLLLLISYLFFLLIFSYGFGPKVIVLHLACKCWIVYQLNKVEVPSV